MSETRSARPDSSIEAEIERVVDLLETVWDSIDRLCSELAPQDWDRPTDCPGWSVKDQVSHIIGTESMLAGRPTPDHKVDPKPWVKNKIGEFNEIHVDFRRNLPPETVLEEFRELAKERLAALRSMNKDDFLRQTMTPVGPDTYLEFMKIRVFDCWVHEQDIRRAVNKPGHLVGPVARHSVGRCFAAMPFVFGKKVAPPDGTTLEIDVYYPDENAPGDRIYLSMVEGRGKALDTLDEPPDACIRLPVDLYVARCCGRIPSDVLFDSANVSIEGDTELGHRVVESLPFMI